MNQFTVVYGKEILIHPMNIINTRVIVHQKPYGYGSIPIDTFLVG
jgi:hypothetical protein